MPKVTGKHLFDQYRKSKGPGNIPPEEMWQLHTRLEELPMDIPRLLNEFEEVTLTRNRLATACYPEHGLPMLLYIAVRHGFDLQAALLANANAGGDNVHRGMVLGLLVGAANRDVPQSLQTGLLDYTALAREIEAFAGMAATPNVF
jgi:hypothetical protein